MKSICSLALAACFAAAAPSQAAVVYSGLQNITVTTTFDGVYLDVDAGTTSGTETTGWDINPFFGGEGVANSPDFQPARTTIALDAPILNIAPGSTVDGTLNFLTGFGGSDSHTGNGVGQFASGTEGYIGFKLTPNDDSGTFYGWMRVVFSNDGSTGVIRDWAYETSGSGITVGAVPEPSAFALLGLGAAGLLRRKRK
ncbi:PEP-CTERM sorting domain-containing protein [Luteolibacter ambystomatis]|uniref:PEP-CTERM sorting domain-containing protein n=1 Tax=Luteolibacter ambystomatis TaxID=2824561 RepID=A0A975J0D0_9BACT|nr:PEP-CTERM sorting domain-containing protein [Luteolibacter ambystomatis]QUE51688.1 PEP-CTERM sorting domain-containing protein [Luteolibacter ambystomatis]